MLRFIRFYLATAAVLALPVAAACQQATPGVTTIGVSLGVTDFHQRDDVVSPYAFGGTLPSVGAGVERRAGRLLLSVEGSYSVGHTNSRRLPRDVEQNLGRFSASVLRALTQVTPGGGGLAVYAGGGVSTLGSVTDVHARDASTGYTYWDWSYYWAHSVDVVLRAEVAGARRSAALQVAGSALRLVSRPNNGKDYNGENARISGSWPRSVLRGSPEYAWERPVLFAEGEYRQRLGARLQLRAAWAVGYASTASPQPARAYLNRLTLGLLRSL